MRLLSLCSVILLSSMLACASRSSIVAPPSSVVAQRTDVSSIVPADLSFAKEFVQFLSDSGWQVHAVRPSKFNSFFRETNRAAWIKTDKDTLEVVFFDNDTAVAQMQISQKRSPASDYHKYVVRTAKTTQRIEGGAAYFTKYRNVLIMTSDRDLNDALNRTASPKVSPAEVFALALVSWTKTLGNTKSLAVFGSERGRGYSSKCVST